MKKYIGLGIGVAVVIGLIASGTWAVFTDTETSTDNKIAAGDADMRQMHGRVGQTHGQQGFQLGAQGTGGVFDTFQGSLVCHADALVVVAFEPSQRHPAFDLRA